MRTVSGRAMGHGAARRLAKWCGFGALVVVVGMAAARSEAAVPDTGLAQETKAYAAFEALVGQLQATGEMPRLTDPSSAAVLGQLWDTSGVLGQPPYTAADNAALQRMATLEVQVLSQYVKAINAGGAATASADFNYENEVARAEELLVATLPPLLDSAADTLKAVDPQRLAPSNLQQFKAAMDFVLNDLQSALGVLSMPGLSAANQGGIAQALSAAAGPVAAHLPPAQRLKVTGMAAKALGKAGPSALTALQTVITAMDTNQCSVLCRIWQLGGPVAAAQPAPAAAPAPAVVQPAAAAPGPAPAPPAQTAAVDPAAVAAPGQGVLIAQPALGVKYGTQPPYRCASTAAPSTGAITAELARQYFTCQKDVELQQSTLFLVTNVNLEVGPPLAKSQDLFLSLDDADLNSPPFPIRGSYDQFQCSALGGTDGIFLTPYNCSVDHHAHASGYCYRNSHDDWKCDMADPNPEHQDRIPWPGPVPAEQLAMARQQAPLQSIASGVSLFEQGDYAGADKSFQSILDQNSADPLAMLWMGVIASKLRPLYAERDFMDLTYAQAEQFTGLSYWLGGSTAIASTHFANCIGYGNPATTAVCTQMQQATQSGAPAPAVNDWPADTGLLKATRELLGGAAAGT